MNILTFDIEEWFHILDNESTKTETNWLNYESRIHRNMDKILDLLAKNDQKATFFCLGWIAEKYPEIIRQIDAFGGEIASHSHLHQLVFEQDRESFKNDLERSIKTIEDITGKKITTYRAPGFSIKEESLWAFEYLLELGIETDCSVFPAKRAHGGIVNFDIKEPFLINVRGEMIKEFPMNVFRVKSSDIVFSGGGYFRFYPYWLIKNMMRQSKYVMTYFHPRDFDYGQPMIKDLSKIRKFKSYVGLKKAFPKFEKLINDFDFLSLDQAERQVNWDNALTVSLQQRRQGTIAEPQAVFTNGGMPMLSKVHQ